MKKMRNRTWYAATFENNEVGVSTEDVMSTKKLVERTILFDHPDAAYAHRMADRMKPLRDENNELVLNDEGIAQLPNYGRVTVFGIKGKAVNWKNVVKVKRKDIGEKATADIIQLGEDLLLNKQTIATILEESDEMYNRYSGSPLAKAGGVTTNQSTPEEAMAQLEREMGVDNGVTSTETVPSEN